MELHHGKYRVAYVKTLNSILGQNYGIGERTMYSSEPHLHPEGTPQLPEGRVFMSKADSPMDNMELKAIAQLAYTYWEARGCPWGSPHEDWFRAEQEIKKSRQWAFPSQR
jgi:hypothetical protein